jgi:cytochrome P450
LSLSIQEWTKTYGRIFGYFEGHTPILVVSDPDVLQDIFIKSFSNFHSRRLFPLADQNTRRVNLFFASGLRWKRQRFIINPTFSSAKLKQMTPLIHRSMSMLMKKLSEEHNKGQPFDIYAYFKRFTMDTIWSCGFSVDTDMQNNINNPYLIHSQEMFGEKVNVRIIVLLALFISELNKFWRTIHLSIGFIKYWFRNHIPITKYFINENPATWIINQAYKIIEKHEKIEQTNRTDLLQLMLESASNEEFIQVFFFNYILNNIFRLFVF